MWLFPCSLPAGPVALADSAADRSWPCSVWLPASSPPGGRQRSAWAELTLVMEWQCHPALFPLSGVSHCPVILGEEVGMHEDGDHEIPKECTVDPSPSLSVPSALTGYYGIFLSVVFNTFCLAVSLLYHAAHFEHFPL